MGRFQELYRERKRYYCEGSPVVIEAWAIQKDLINGVVIAQVKLTNISHREIVACKVLINEYEINGDIIKKKVEYSYLDLHAKYGDSFGTKKPIYIESNTRRISVIVSEVVYDNGDCWKTDNEWEIVPEQKKLDDFIENKKLLEEYIRINRSGKFIPQKWNNTFLCACGAVNIYSETKCYCCGALFENITKYLDLTLLNDVMQKRISEEERIKYIEEEKLLQRKIQNRAKRKKIVLVTMLLIIIFSVSGYFLINSDMIQRPMTYNQAMEYYEAGDYKEAIKLFKKISLYKDSAEMLNKSIYSQAEEYYEDGDYYNARIMWEKIEDYSDSSERLKNVEWRINIRKNR